MCEDAHVWARRLVVATVIGLLPALAACTNIMPKDPHRLTEARAAKGAGRLAPQRGLDTVEEIAAAAPGEVMALEVEDDGGHRLVVRFTVSEDQIDGSTRTWHGCWRYRFSSAGGLTDGPDAVGCPDGGPLEFAPPSTTVPLDLGEDPEALARRAFESLSTDDWSDVERVRDIAERTFAPASASPLPVEVERSGRVTGVAIGVPGECLLVRSEPLDVWMPGRIYRSFRDEACLAVDAVEGNMRRAPH